MILDGGPVKVSEAVLATATIHSMVAQQVPARADRIAVADPVNGLTFAGLEERTHTIAARLVAAGVRPGDLVGVYLDRSVNLVAGVLGVLRAGAAYVPLDPEFPRERLEFMVSDAAVQVILTESGLASSAPEASAQLLVDETTAQLPTLHALPDVAPDALAYVTYTSGSTGRPKGVRLTHRSVVNLLCSMAVEPGISADDVWLAVTTLSFDISVLELLGPLLAGATTVVATRDEVMDGEKLARAIERCGATILQATPVYWRLLLESGWPGDARLKALCGGEALPRDLAQALLPRVGSLWNMYGPTETTIWSTCFRVEDATRPILIGRPVANTSVYVLDAHMRPVPAGVPGEIYIGGAGVAAGYHDREELTRERFVPDPFAGDGARMYRTGDLGRLLRDGSLEYRSRADDQVKIRGFRVELGEIEAALASIEGVGRASVVVRRGTAGDDRLIAFMTGDPAVPDVDALRTCLSAQLPQYMVPHHFVHVASFPTTPNGKLDRGALLALWSGVPAEDGKRMPPATGAEKLVAEVMAEVLNVPPLSVHANFFDMGGHSVLAMRAIALLRERGADGVALRDLFQAPTVAGLAARLDDMLKAPAELSASGHTPDREEVVF
jgi:amino acid adenylation domain-containing protein